MSLSIVCVTVVLHACLSIESAEPIIELGVNGVHCGRWCHHRSYDNYDSSDPCQCANDKPNNVEDLCNLGFAFSIFIVACSPS